jgi:hypothetical protein
MNPSPARAKARLRRGPAGAGQALTETLLMMSFLLLFVFSIVHLSILAATKYVVNYAAFAAARTLMVQGTEEGWDAALEVMHNLRWWKDEARNAPDRPEFENRYRRSGVTIRHRVPLGLPMFNRIPDGGLEVVGFAPVTPQPQAPQVGDNCLECQE